MAVSLLVHLSYGVVAVLILCTVATFGPLDVLFVGSLGAGRIGGAQFKRPEKQIIRELGSTSETHREI